MDALATAIIDDPTEKNDGVYKMTSDFDVVIVGGGPCGLWLACELALAKVKVAVLERRAGPVAHSRALTVHSRTLEVFAMRGIVDRFVSRGRPVSTYHYGGLDTKLDVSVFDTRFPYTLLLPQSTTEQLLEEHALELGVDIKHGHFVEALKQHAQSVIIEGRVGESPFRIATDYVVGADGTRSVVRRAAEIAFSGYSARHTLMLGDVILDAPPPPPIVTIVNDAGSLYLAPSGDGVHHRLGVIDATSWHTARPDPLSLPELAEAVSRIAGTDFRSRDPIWLSRFTDETRLADRYRKGRIFLVGDAAHMNVPMGGQGMNVGIQDAMNLGWKLASVVLGTAPGELLDTYERERRPVGESVHRDTLAQFALFTAFDPPTQALRQVFEGVLHVPEINERLAEHLCGFAVTYPEPLPSPCPEWEYWQGLSGRRLPDLDLVLEDGSEATLFRLLEDGDWVQVQLAPGLEILRDPFFVANGNVSDGADNVLRGKFDSVLVRPDGYLAHVHRASDDRDVEKSVTRCAKKVVTIAALRTGLDNGRSRPAVSETEMVR
jgi:2-polyprenyl-6-methoxyphenol hydroxylase-like FAD-dependent oxidoreductase